MYKPVSCIILLIAFINIAGCKRPYEPPAIQADHKFLVVDGVLVNSVDSPTIITLSRTIKLTDTITSATEPGASVSVEGNTGENFTLSEVANGVYKANQLSLNYANKYRLKITTTDGNQYMSDYVEVKQTPPIDSVTWKQPNDAQVYINTHDPLNNSRYYEWNFIETWQYSAQFQRSISEKNGLIYYLDSTNETYNCWQNSNSSQILTGSSAALSQDVISNTLIATVPQNSEKIGIRYSIVIKQYSLTQQAYEYLQILKKNTEERGSLFDTQPTELIGNIHSVKNPAEVVIGYLIASSVQQKRIFIKHSEVTDWNPVNTGRSCDIIKIPQDPNNYLLYTYPDLDFTPYYFSSMPPLLVVTRKSCVDCTVKGGSTSKPSFW